MLFVITTLLKQHLRRNSEGSAMIYQPIHIEAVGAINETWGIGVITSLGCYITSKIPPFERIFAKSFIPKRTIFKKLDGTKVPYILPPSVALGVKQLTAYMKKPKPHYETIKIRLTEAVPIDVDIIIEEIDVGSFKVMPYNLGSKTITQPFNGWTSSF